MFEQYKNTNQPGAKPAAVPKHIPTDEELLARLDPGGAPLSVPPVDAPPAAAAAVAAEPPEVSMVHHGMPLARPFALCASSGPRPHDCPYRLASLR